MALSNCFSICVSSIKTICSMRSLKENSSGLSAVKPCTNSGVISVKMEPTLKVSLQRITFIFLLGVASEVSPSKSGRKGKEKQISLACWSCCVAIMELMISQISRCIFSIICGIEAGAPATIAAISNKSVTPFIILSNLGGINPGTFGAGKLPTSNPSGKPGKGMPLLIISATIAPAAASQSTFSGSLKSTYWLTKSAMPEKPTDSPLTRSENACAELAESKVTKGSASSLKSSVMSKI